MGKKNTAAIDEFHLNKLAPERPQFVVHDLNAYQKENASHNTRPHIHSFYQIIWFKKGTGTHFVDFKAYDVHNNAIFFIAKNQVHYFDHNPDYEGVLLHFNESFLVQSDDEADFFLKCSIFNSPFQQPSCCVQSDITAILDSYIASIRTELCGNEAFGKKEMLRTFLKAFLIQVQRRKNDLDQQESAGKRVQSEKRMQLMKFVNLLDENYNKGLSVAEYAKLILISTRTLSELTSQLTGKTPSQMIHERIVLEAQRLLLHSKLNVTQIGYRLGFDDPSYFVKFFKRHSDQSPLEFKRSIS